MGTQDSKFGIIHCFVNTLVMQYVLVDGIGLGHSSEVSEDQVQPNFVLNNFIRPLTRNSMLFSPRAESVAY